jgi:hypothetical protein
MSSELYKIIHDPELKVASLEPSEYFMRLSVEEGVAKLKSHIEILKEELRQHQRVFMNDDVDIPKSLEKMRRLILELELCQQCIPYFQECRHFSPRPLQMVSRLPSAA